MVKSIATSKSGLASTAGTKEQNPSTKAGSDPTSAFTGVAIGMSWQLAVIVLLPIIGGYKIDQASGGMPWWTLVGVVLAVVGSIIVIRRALAALGNFTPPAGIASDAGKPQSTAVADEEENQ